MNCLVKPCSHAEGDVECGKTIFVGMMARRGDPKLLCETAMLAKLFRVSPLPERVCAYGLVNVPGGTKLPISELLTKMDPVMQQSCLDMPVSANEMRAAIVHVFSALLPSMGLRYAEPVGSEPLCIVPDDPNLDRGYGAGAATKFREEGWGRGAIKFGELGAATDDAVATRGVILAMLSLASARPDMAIELMSRLTTEKHAKGEPIEVDVDDPRDTDKAPRGEICKKCFSHTASGYIFVRVMLLARAFCAAELITPRATPEQKDGMCKCGFSLMRIRVKGARPGGKPSPTSAIDICPYWIVHGWKLGCGAWVVE
jgi:hypothetical protein